MAAAVSMEAASTAVALAAAFTEAAGTEADGAAAAGAGGALAGAAVGVAAVGIAAGAGAAVGAGVGIRLGDCGGDRARRGRDLFTAGLWRRPALLGQAARLDSKRALYGPAARERLLLS
jgi:hypothetical protein